MDSYQRFDKMRSGNVDVNIGGRMFTISSKTYSQLKRVIKGNQTNCFIDRDPVLYEYILDYLRCGDEVVNKLLPKEIKWRIWVEAESLELDHLADEFQAK